MKLNKIELCTEAACSLKSNPVLFPDAMALFTPAQIKTEIKSLSKKLLPLDNVEADLSDDEWNLLINNFLLCIGLMPGNESVDDIQMLTTDEERYLIHQQLKKVVAALDYASRCVDAQSSPTGLLLPVSYQSRLRYLLGYGQLPVAWVRTLDILKF